MATRPGPRLAGITAALAVACLASTHAVDLHLDREAIDNAIIFARQATKPERAAFHDGYQRQPGGEVLRISIVTEYRRVVLTVEEKMRTLDRNYGQRQMAAMLTPWRGLVEIIVELQFHPQNSYVQVPLIDVLLVPLDEPGTPMPLVAEATDRLPHFGMFWDPAPPDSPWWPFPPATAPRLGGTEPLTGGWVQARFPAAGLTRGRYEVAVKNGAASLGRAQFDFGAIR